MVFAALLSFLAFLGLAIQFVVATVESYLVIGAGFLFLGFGGSRWTAPYVERYIAYAVSVGVKIMIFYLLIGAGFILSAGWVTAAGNIALSSQPAIDALDIAAAAVILLMICWHAPKLAAAILGGSPAFTGGDAVATGGALLGGAAAVAGLAAGGVALGAKMLAARGGAMAVSQAAGMRAGGGAAGADLAGGVAGGGAGGGKGGAGAAASVPAAGGALSGLSGASGQPLPPSSTGNSRVAEPNQATSSFLIVPSQGSPTGGKAQRRAAIADAAAQATIRGGMAVQQLRSAIPSDAAHHVPPPPLNTGPNE
jgi:type IV secretion system protein TrbL